MLSTTLDQGLKAYGIGPKLRRMRLKKSMGLVQLGHHTGLSPAMLSKIERGQLYPTLPTLLRIALVFGVGLDHFFMAPREKPPLGVVRRKDRIRLTETAGNDAEVFKFESLDYTAVERHLNSYYAVFPAVDPDALQTHEHAGGESIYVLQGTLTVRVGDEEHVLDAGDSMYFDSSVAHGYRRSGGRACHAVITTTA